MHEQAQYGGRPEDNHPPQATPVQGRILEWTCRECGVLVQRDESGVTTAAALSQDALDACQILRGLFSGGINGVPDDVKVVAEEAARYVGLERESARQQIGQNDGLRREVKLQLTERFKAETDLAAARQELDDYKSATQHGIGLSDYAALNARLTRLRAWLEQEIARLQIRGTEWDGGYNEACERILARLGEV
jgi:hypothetical protein